MMVTSRNKNPAMPPSFKCWISQYYLRSSSDLEAKEWEFVSENRACSEIFVSLLYAQVNVGHKICQITKIHHFHLEE